MVQIHLPLLFQDVGKSGIPPGTDAQRWSPEPRDRRFKSDRPDSAFPQTFRCGQTVRQPPVKRMSAGSIPATGAFFIEQPISRFERRLKRREPIF